MAVDWDKSANTFLDFWVDALYKRIQCLGYIQQKCDPISKGFLYHSAVVDCNIFHQIVVEFQMRYSEALGRDVPWPGTWACRNPSAGLAQVCRQVAPSIYEGAEWQVNTDSTAI